MTTARMGMRNETIFFIINYFNINNKIKLLTNGHNNVQHCCANNVACWCVLVVVLCKRMQQLPTTCNRVGKRRNMKHPTKLHRLHGALKSPTNLALPNQISLSNDFCFLVLLFTKQTSRGTDVSKYFSFIPPPPFSIKVLSPDDKRSRENTQRRVCCDKG